jgi:hypothetical protein
MWPCKDKDERGRSLCIVNGRIASNPYTSPEVRRALASGQFAVVSTARKRTLKYKPNAQQAWSRVKGMLMHELQTIAVENREPRTREDAIENRLYWKLRRLGWYDTNPDGSSKCLLFLSKQLQATLRKALIGWHDFAHLNVFLQRNYLHHLIPLIFNSIWFKPEVYFDGTVDFLHDCLKMDQLSEQIASEPTIYLVGMRESREPIKALFRFIYDIPPAHRSYALVRVGGRRLNVRRVWPARRAEKKIWSRQNDEVRQESILNLRFLRGHIL